MVHLLKRIYPRNSQCKIRNYSINRILTDSTLNSFFVCLHLAPVVTLVVDGGDSTISNIYYDLKSNIPVVIMNVRLEN